MMIAKAILLVAGPCGSYPTTHGCDGEPLTSAVPVFPAIRHGWLLRLRPVPLTTASRMYRASRSAASGGNTTSVLAESVEDVSHRTSRSTPSLARAAATRAILSGVASTSPCPYPACGSVARRRGNELDGATEMPSRP